MLEVVENDEVKTQVNVFSEHKEEDAEEFSHRYDNVRMEMEYPFCIETPRKIIRRIFKIFLLANDSKHNSACPGFKGESNKKQSV